MAEKKVYFNKPQRLTQLIGANTTVIVAGRRTGKTDSIAAPFVLRNMQAYARLDRRHRRADFQALPDKHAPRLARRMVIALALCYAKNRWGYIESVHYVMGRKPLKSFSLSMIGVFGGVHLIFLFSSLFEVEKFNTWKLAILIYGSLNGHSV